MPNIGRERHMERKRSPGITLIGWLEALLGWPMAILGALAFLFFFFSYDYSNRTGYEQQVGYAQWMGLGMIVSGIVFVPGVFLLISGMNTLRLKEWARVLNIRIAIGLLVCLLVLLYLVRSGNLYFVPRVFLPAAGLALLKIWYFTRPLVKEQFVKDPPAQEGETGIFTRLRAVLFGSKDIDN
jgi:hypothetical protein